MDINERLYVEIVPDEGPRAPVPNPITVAKFDTRMVYKVLGVFNPSETSESYFILANPTREMWYISQRHLRAYGLINSDKLFLIKPTANVEAKEPASENGNSRRAGLMGRLQTITG